MKRYGFLLIFGVLFLGSMVAHGVLEVSDTADRMALHGESYSTSDGMKAWARATFENWQSEWMQLFFQGLILIALQQRLARKDSENTKSDVREVLREEGLL